MSRLFLPLALFVGLAACGDKDRTLKVTGLSPETGDANGGTYVVVKGNGFTSPSRMAKIYFGSGTAARQGQVVRFQSDSELIVMAPGGKPDEVVDVLITFEPGGVLRIPKAFKFVEKDVGGASVDDLVGGDKKKK
jgi:hypothetical protein